MDEDDLSDRDAPIEQYSGSQALNFRSIKNEKLKESSAEDSLMSEERAQDDGNVEPVLLAPPCE